MQRQSSHAGRGVEGLGHRDENRAGRLEPLDELCKVGEATGQPVDLVDHNLVDFAEHNQYLIQYTGST